jgi:hypothetical protein
MPQWLQGTRGLGDQLRGRSVRRRRDRRRLVTVQANGRTTSLQVGDGDAGRRQRGQRGTGARSHPSAFGGWTVRAVVSCRLRPGRGFRAGRVLQRGEVAGVERRCPVLNAVGALQRLWSEARHACNSDDKHQELRDPARPRCSRGEWSNDHIAPYARPGRDAMASTAGPPPHRGRQWCRSVPLAWCC